MLGVPDCPHVWCDFNLLGDPRLTERIKFNVLEIQENFENFVDKKDTTWSCLEGLKAHVKLVSLGESIDTCVNLDTDQVELCRFLYKLHFQQLLLLESYTKLLQLLSGAAGSSGVVDLSDQVAAVRANLLTALADTLTPPASPPGHSHTAPGSPNRASTPSPETGDSPTPRASPPAEKTTPTTVSVSDTDKDNTEETEALFVPTNDNSELPEISLTLPAIRYLVLV